MLTHIREYHRPPSLDQAVALLVDPGRLAVPVAGATSAMIRNQPGPSALVDLADLGLDTVKFSTDCLEVGAMVRISTLTRDGRITSFVGHALGDAAKSIGTTPLRNLITVGGNVIDFGQGTDLPPVLLALDAEFLFDGIRPNQFPAVTFLTTTPQNHLERGDILTTVRVPRLPAQTGTTFLKWGRTIDGFPQVSIAIRIQLLDGIIASPRVVVGAIVHPPKRLRTAEMLLNGKSPQAELFHEAAIVASNEVDPEPDLPTSSDFQRHLLKVLIARSLALAVDRARKATP